VDFGCGDGAVLEAVAQRSFYRSPELIGIDHTPACMPGSMTRVVGGPSTLAQGWLRDRAHETTLILSSVLHEVVSEAGRLDTLPVSSLRPRFIAIRDMAYPEHARLHSLSADTIEKLRAMGSGDQWRTFQQRWGDVDNWEAAAHWVLKSPYAANWQHELGENYLAVNRKALTDWLDWLGYRIVHRRVFTPQPVEARFREYEVPLPWHTHIELVAELCP